MRFLDKSGRALTHLTRVIKATQATRALEFDAFPVTITVPTTAPEGPLVYAAIIRPINCPNFTQQVVVPLSEAIMVER